jgi:hypothetical protein
VTVFPTNFTTPIKVISAPVVTISPTFVLGHTSQIIQLSGDFSEFDSCVFSMERRNGVFTTLSEVEIIGGACDTPRVVGVGTRPY